MKNYVNVPIRELQDLEQMRVKLYKYLSKYMSDKELLILPLYTQQIWKVANTLEWK